MPKLTNRPPRLCKKNNNCGVVYVGGREIYMGKWGKTAETNYRAFLVQWAAMLPEEPESLNHSKGIAISVLFDKFIEAMERDEKGSLSDLNRYRAISRKILSVYPKILSDDFGPVQLESIRSIYQREGFERCEKHHEYSRQYLNRITKSIRTIFSWGVGKALCKPETHLALKYVRPLREGHCDAPESPPRNPVSEKDFETVLPYLLPTYRDVLLLIRYTAMRPSEVCRLRVHEIDRSGDVWVYLPTKHKTRGRGKERAIPFGERSQAVLRERLEGLAPDDIVFTPYDVAEERRKQKRAERKTRVQPSQQKRDEESAKKRVRVNRQLDVSSISRNVVRAIDKARADGIEVGSWTPYCVRHLVVTEIAEKEGIVAGQRIAGHASLKTTEIYNHAALVESIELARKYG